MSATTFFQNARGVRAALPIGFIGQPLDRGHATYESRTGSNSGGQAKQVVTQTVHASPDSSTLYSVTVDGVTASYTTDASATQAELGAGLVEAINATPGIRAKMIATYAGGVLTLTAVWPGISHTVTNNAADTTNDLGTPTTATAAASASAIEFGRVLIDGGSITGEAIRKVKAPVSADFSAQVITFTYGSVGSGDEVSMEIEFQGKRFAETVTYATSQTATLAALVTAMDVILDAAFGAGLSILLASDATTITLAADEAGAEFDATSSVSGAGTVAKAYTTGPSTSTSIKRAMLGISARREDVEDQTVGGDDPAYAANDSVEYVSRSTQLVVEKPTTESWSRGDDLYVSLASATAGQLYNSAAADRVWLGNSPVRIVRDEYSSTSDGVAVIAIDMGA